MKRVSKQEYLNQLLKKYDAELSEMDQEERDATIDGLRAEAQFAAERDADGAAAKREDFSDCGPRG